MRPESIPADCRVDLLALAAHPDDVEIGIGGTLAKLSQRGVRCAIADLTNAEPTPANSKYRSPDDFDNDYDAKRLAEADAAAAALGVELRVTLDLPNRRIFDNFENRCKVATLIRRLRPRIVLVMYNRTVRASPDHYQAQLICEAAIFYARLTKWDRYFDGLPVHRIGQLLYYPVESVLHPEGDVGRLTSFFIDITETIELKRKAIHAYSSQFQEQGNGDFVERILERNSAAAVTMGFGRPVRYVEHLASPQPLLLDDLSLFLG